MATRRKQCCDAQCHSDPPPRSHKSACICGSLLAPRLRIDFARNASLATRKQPVPREIHRSAYPYAKKEKNEIGETGAAIYDRLTESAQPPKRSIYSPCGVCAPTDREAQVIPNGEQRTSSGQTSSQTSDKIGKLPLRPLVVAMLVTAFVSFTMADASPVTAEDEAQIQTATRFSFTAGHRLPKSMPQAQTASAPKAAQTPAEPVMPANGAGAPGENIVPRATASIPHAALSSAKPKAPAACSSTAQPAVATPTTLAPVTPPAVTETAPAETESAPAEVAKLEKAHVSPEPRKIHRHRARRHHASSTRGRAASDDDAPKWLTEAWSPDG